MKKIAWIVGGVTAACVLDLLYMFWNHTNPGHNFNRASWHATGLGRGKYSLLPRRK